MTKQAKALKFYQLAIDYRSAGSPGCWLTCLRAGSEAEAIEQATAELRRRHINLTITKAIARPSGWNR